jgi:hypothetical protein
MLWTVLILIMSIESLNFRNLNSEEAQAVRMRVLEKSTCTKVRQVQKRNMYENVTSAELQQSLYRDDFL